MVCRHAAGRLVQVMRGATKGLVVVVGVVVCMAAVCAWLYEPTCSNGVYRELHSSCAWPK